MSDVATMTPLDNDRPTCETRSTASTAAIRARLRVRATTVASRLADVLSDCEAEQFQKAAEFCAHAVADMAESSQRSSTEPFAATALVEDPIDRLIQRFQLDAAEVDLLLLAGLADEHDGFAGTFALLHPLGEPWPTAGLLACMPDDGLGFDALARALAEGELVRSGGLALLGQAPTFRRSLRLAPGLWFALQGFDSWPEGVTRRHIDAVPFGLDEWLAEPEVRMAQRALHESRSCSVMVLSESEDVAVNRALTLVASAGRTDEAAVLDLVDPSRINADVLDLFITAHGVLPVVRVGGEPEGTRHGVPALRKVEGPVVFCGRAGDLPIAEGRPVISLSTRPQAHPSRVAMWSGVLPQLRDAAATLASHHALEPGLARQVASDVTLRATLRAKPGSKPIDVRAEESDVVASVRSRIGVSLPPGVELREPRVRLADVVVSTRAGDQLQAIVSRLASPGAPMRHHARERAGGRGVRALLVGPPGTGKTFTAEALAGELDTDLLQIDISRVVSKWIGETEKNLAAAFDAAERSKAVLFFDEADALLGERTSVGDSNDRYANMETAYLLSRIERCEGLIVLATNLIRNIDDAFMRRMEFVIQLSEPTVKERVDLWTRELGNDQLLDATVDIADISRRYEIPGALIRNAAEGAMFRATARGGNITGDDLRDCIEIEYLKVGRSIPPKPTPVKQPWEW
jgi:ATPase family associated with various cellular activities (AAA)